MLYLTEPIDEVVFTNLAKFDDKDLVDVTKEDLSLGDEEDKAKVGPEGIWTGRRNPGWGDS